MRRLFVLLLCCAFFSMNAQSSKNKPSPTIADFIVGKWHLSKVFDGKKEIPVESQQGIISTLILMQNNIFVSYTNDEQIDSGYFRINEIDHLLYLETAKNIENTPQEEWSVKIYKSILTLSRRQPVEARRFRYEYLRY